MEIKHLVGVDIGGSHYSVGIFTLQGKLLDYRYVSTIIRGQAERILEEVACLICEVMAKNQARAASTAVGLGMPGPQDRRRGVITKAHNIGWYDVPVTEPLSRRIGCPCFMENDAVAATCGEWWQGAGRGTDHLVGLAIGTGLGGGMMVNGRAHYGADDIAGHFGHLIIDLNGRQCPCGVQGCLEAYVATGGILKTASELGLELSQEEGVKPLYDMALAGDTRAIATFARTADYLAAGIASIVHGLNPQKIVVGGAIALAGDVLFTPLRERLAVRVFPAARPNLSVEPFQLGDRSAVYGAAIQALHHMQE